jgi:hypothetical protein
MRDMGKVNTALKIYKAVILKIVKIKMVIGQNGLKKG